MMARNFIQPEKLALFVWGISPSASLNNTDSAAACSPKTINSIELYHPGADGIRIAINSDAEEPRQYQGGNDVAMDIH